jgi:hypothetical protein
VLIYELGKPLGQSGLIEFFNFVSHAEIGAVDFDHPR